jgi:hypothetical protein
MFNLLKKIVGIFLFLSAAFSYGESVQGPNLGGRLQVLGVGEKVNDPIAYKERVYLFMKQARLNVSGKAGKFKYFSEIGFAGEEEAVVAPNPGVTLNLLSCSVDMQLGESTFLKVGQFKVPYSRERLTDSGHLLFDTRSLQNLGFRIGYDVGLALHQYHGNFAYAFGVFTGGGRDIPERYLPESLGVPMLVTRLGWNNGYDEDIFTTRHKKHDVDTSGQALFFNAMYTKDSLVGHSSVQNVKLTEKSLLTNPNWNPYIGKTPLDKSVHWQVGLDAANRMSTSFGHYSLEFEANYAKFENSYGLLNIAGGRLEGGAIAKPLGYSLRYAVLYPDKRFSYAYTDASTKARVEKKITTGKAIHEITPAISYFFEKEQAKIILDFPYFIQVPVAIEDKVGAYVLTEQVDQVSVLSKSGSSIERQNVPEIRILFQMMF